MKRLSTYSLRRVIPRTDVVELPVDARVSGFDRRDDADTSAAIAKTTYAVQGIFDTGATSTVISTDLAEALALPVIDRVISRSADVALARNVHMINLFLGDRLLFTGLTVLAMPLTGDSLLVGMDVIGRGDFRVSLRHDFLVVDFDLYMPVTDKD